MPRKNGAAAFLVEFVEQHPGCTRGEILAGLGLGADDAMPSYCMRHGLIFAAGKRRLQRYYATAELAADAQAAVLAQIELDRRQKVAMHSRTGNLRKRARRLAAGGKMINTRPGKGVALDPGVKLKPDARMVIAPQLPGRWETVGNVPSVVDSTQARPWAQCYAASIGAAP